ncbi:MAG: hypothetical protein ACO1SV_01740 [Fimbriimonas sp.]
MRTPRISLAILLLVSLGLLAGCGEPKPEFGDKKEDWQKSKPPEGWKGPGQADGPKSGPISGPPGGQ